MEQIIKSLGDMEGKIIIDLSWPENEFGEDGYFQITAEPSGAEIIQGWIPKAMVVKAFGTTGTNVIDNPDDAGGEQVEGAVPAYDHADEDQQLGEKITLLAGQINAANYRRRI